jgi:hypothetical protein
VPAARLEVFVAPRTKVEAEFERFVAGCSAPRTEYSASMRSERRELARWRQTTRGSAMKVRKVFAARAIGVITLTATTLGLAPPASAVPAPEVEFTYNVVFRRHYNFPNNDAIGYGYGICDKVGRAAPYATVMAEVKADITPNDEQSANKLVSNAVGILCPASIWQLRNSAAGYQPT